MYQVGLRVKERFNVVDEVGTGCVLIETRRFRSDLLHSCTPAHCYSAPCFVPRMIYIPLRENYDPKLCIFSSKLLSYLI